MNFVFLLALRLEIRCGIVELLDALFSISIRTEDEPLDISSVAAPVARSLMLLASFFFNSLGILPTQLFTLGVASSSVFWWKYCVIVHVGIRVAKFLRNVRNQSRAMDCFCFALADVPKDSPTRLLMLGNEKSHNCMKNSQKALNNFGVSHDVHQ